MCADTRGMDTVTSITAYCVTSSFGLHSTSQVMAHRCEERDLVPLGGSSHASGTHLNPGLLGSAVHTV